MLGLGQEVGQVAAVDLGLLVDAALQESLAGRVEGAVQDGEEGAGVLGEDLAGVVVQSTQDGDILELSVDVSHDG